MFWADILAKNLIGKGPHLVDDAKTPSGKVHVGALRGVLVHDFVHKALLEAGEKSRYTYIIDDFDPMDGLPVYLDQEKYKQYMGMPLSNIPAPEGEGTYGEYYAEDFQNIFNSLGAKPEILWSSKLYKEGKLDPAIKIALDNAEKIQTIYHDVSGSEKIKGWLPFQPICPQCGKIGTTLATSWDGKEVTFSCEPSMVTWAQGCGYSGKISPFSGNGKLPWKVEWPATWFYLGVTVEGAGKDHSSKGGSRDVANHIIKEVYDQEPPSDVAYEHILLGGRKMSSSKGLGASAREVSEILPPELLRFLFARVPYQRAIDFDPSNPSTIPDLFDEFDRGQKAYFAKDNQDLAKTWQVSQIGDIQEEFNLRFSLLKELVINLKTEDDIFKEAEKLKASPLSETDKNAIKMRIKYVKIWLEKFGQEATLVEEITLSDKQKAYLKDLATSLPSSEVAEEIQNFIYNKGKDLGLAPKEAFQAVYASLLGKAQGPQAGSLVLSIGIEVSKKKFDEASK